MRFEITYLKVNTKSAVVVADGHLSAGGSLADVEHIAVGVGVQVETDVGVDWRHPGDLGGRSLALPGAVQLAIGGGDLALPAEAVSTDPLVLAVGVNIKGHSTLVLEVPLGYEIKLPLCSVQVEVDLVLGHIIPLPAEGGGEALAIGQGHGVADLIVALGKSSRTSSLPFSSIFLSLLP